MNWGQAVYKFGVIVMVSGWVKACNWGNIKSNSKGFQSYKFAAPTPCSGTTNTSLGPQIHIWRKYVFGVQQTSPYDNCYFGLFCVKHILCVAGIILI
jgi:hypothetical protein